MLINIPKENLVPAVFVTELSPLKPEYPVFLSIFTDFNSELLGQWGTCPFRHKETAGIHVQEHYPEDALFSMGRRDSGCFQFVLPWIFPFGEVLNIWASATPGGAGLGSPASASASFLELETSQGQS